jgi:AAA+ superfamily predicted ATPase
MAEHVSVNQEKSTSAKVNFQVKKNDRTSMADLKIVETNIQALAGSIIWIEELMRMRMKELEGGPRTDIEEYADKIDKTYLTEKTSFYKLLDEYNNSFVEYLLVSLGFTSWFRPKSLFELAKAKPDSTELFSETGLISNKAANKYIPTLQTAIFLLAGTNISKQAFYHGILLDHTLFKDQVLHLRKPSAFHNFPNDFILEIDLSYYNFLLNGKKPRYDSSPDFPATLLETEKEFDDLILKESTSIQLDTIMQYASNRSSLYQREGVAHKIKPGLLAMLYGPPGTGKTFTVAVMSKKLGIDAYRIDLSRVISKYIGETEKNLEKIFERLSDKNCILFFDEADALFGKRTEVSDAKDRYANQEVAYLLQRVESFPGLVILASNYKQNLDKAFKRRILVSIYLAPPDSEERLILWNNGLPQYFKYVPENLPVMLAEKHPFTGANIDNIIKLSCITAESDKTNEITLQIMEPFIKQEYNKEGFTGKKVSHASAHYYNRE